MKKQQCRIAAFLRVYCQYPNPEAVTDARIIAEFEKLGDDQELWLIRAEHLMKFAGIPHSPDIRKGAKELEIDATK